MNCAICDSGDIGDIGDIEVKRYSRSSLRSGSIPVQTLCVRFHPTDTNHLFVGTDEVIINH